LASYEVALCILNAVYLRDITGTGRYGAARVEDDRRGEHRYTRWHGRRLETHDYVCMY